MRSFKQVDDKHAFNLDNRQIAYLGTGLVTLFLLFFLLGVLYGTRLGGLQLTEASAASAPAPAPAPSVDEQPAPREEFATASVKEFPEAVAGEEPGRPDIARSERVFELGEESLSVEDAAALRKRLTAVRVPEAGGTAPVQQKVPAPVVRTAAATPVPAGSAPKAPSGPAPAPEPRKESAPALRGLPAGEGNYTVQVASLPDGKGAEGLAADLARKGYPAYVVAADVKGRTYYRVRFGRYGTREDADRAADRYQRYERKETLVTRIE